MAGGNSRREGRGRERTRWHQYSGGAVRKSAKTVSRVASFPLASLPRKRGELSRTPPPAYAGGSPRYEVLKPVLAKIALLGHDRYWRQMVVLCELRHKLLKRHGSARLH